MKSQKILILKGWNLYVKELDDGNLKIRNNYIIIKRQDLAWRLVPNYPNTSFNFSINILFCSIVPMDTLIQVPPIGIIITPLFCSSKNISSASLYTLT